MLLPTILLILIAILIALLAYILLKRQANDPQQLELVLSRAWSNMQLDEKLGRFETYARDIRDDYRSLDQLLRSPKERSDLSETALEGILSDQLPERLYGIRCRVLNGKIPDAFIQSPVGLICIDAKFPLDNYRQMIEAQTVDEKAAFKKQFVRNVKDHLQKIAGDYICPEAGSAEFAFAYIHSEAVYWFLVTEASSLLREFTKKGVQVVSPLTLSHKVELIKANVFAKKLTDEADQIRTEIARIACGFQELDKEWRILYQTHFKNLNASIHRVDAAYQKLGDEFVQIRQLSEE